MRIEPLAIPGPLIFSPLRHGDARGYFAETFRQDAFAQHVPGLAFVQDNEARSTQRGVVRGLHCQDPPCAQGKLVRVIRGAIFDVVVDARPGSATYGRHAGVELSEADGRQLWAPPGFLHGYCTLTEETVVAYKVTGYYSAAHDRSVRFDDPQLGIAWPWHDRSLLSAKDLQAPAFSEMPPVFAGLT